MDKDNTNRDIIIIRFNQHVEKLLCTLCCFLIFPPMQLICCGVRICEMCAKTRLKDFSQCPYCSEPGVPEARHDKGYERELRVLQSDCPRCNDQWSGYYKDLPKHLDNHHDLKCDNCDETFYLPQQLGKHQQETCKHRMVSCPLAFIGCSSKVLYQKIGDHYLEQSHQRCLARFMKEVLPQLSHGQSTLASQKAYDEHYNRGLVECLQKIDSQIQEINSINDNCSHLNSERQATETKINEIREQAAKIKESSDNSTKLIESLHQMLMNMMKLLDEIKSKSVTGPKLMEDNSTYIFKLNFLLLINSGQTVNCESFQTSQSGYKVALRVDIQTDEQRQKGYLSVSFMILRGDFDAILSWPFPFPITISAVDPLNTQKDITKKIIPDSRSAEFARPVDNANKPCCITQFCPIENILEKNNSYLQDGFLFLRVHIDFMAVSVQPSPAKAPLRATDDPIQKNILSPMTTK